MSPAQRDDPVSHVGGALGHPPDRLREKRIRCPYPFRRVRASRSFRIVKEIAFGFRLRIPQADYLGSLHGKNVPEHRPLSNDETRQKKLLHCPGIDFRLHSGIFHRPQQVVRHQPCVPEPGRHNGKERSRSVAAHNAPSRCRTMAKQPFNSRTNSPKAPASRSRGSDQSTESGPFVNGIPVTDISLHANHTGVMLLGKTSPGRKARYDFS